MKRIRGGRSDLFDSTWGRNIGLLAASL